MVDPTEPVPAPPKPPRYDCTDFHGALTDFLNRHSVDAELDVADRLLATYLCDALRSFDHTRRAADVELRAFYGLAKGEDGALAAMIDPSR